MSANIDYGKVAYSAFVLGFILGSAFISIAGAIFFLIISLL